MLEFTGEWFQKRPYEVIEYILRADLLKSALEGKVPSRSKGSRQVYSILGRGLVGLGIPPFRVELVTVAPPTLASSDPGGCSLMGIVMPKSYVPEPVFKSMPKPATGSLGFISVGSRSSQIGVSPSIPPEGDADADASPSGARAVKIGSVTGVVLVSAVANVVVDGTIYIFGYLHLELQPCVFGMILQLGFPMNPLDGIGRPSSVRSFTVAEAIALKRESNVRPPLPYLTRMRKVKSDPCSCCLGGAFVLLNIGVPGVFSVNDELLLSCGPTVHCYSCMSPMVHHLQYVYEKELDVLSCWLYWASK